MEIGLAEMRKIVKAESISKAKFTLVTLLAAVVALTLSSSEKCSE